MIASTINFFMPHIGQFMETFLSTSLNFFISVPLLALSDQLQDLSLMFLGLEILRQSDRVSEPVALSLWRALPGSMGENDSIQSFKTSLKTHFFNCN